MKRFRMTTLALFLLVAALATPAPSYMSRGSSAISPTDGLRRRGLPVFFFFFSIAPDPSGMLSQPYTR